MKKIINHLIHRIKEGSLPKSGGREERKIGYRELTVIKSVLVCWMAHEDQGLWLKTITEKFRSMKIDKLCFLAENGVMPGFDAVIVRKEDLGFGGRIQNDALHGILERKYDLLIDLTAEESAMVNYVLEQSQASCKASMKKNGFQADLIVDGVNQPLEFVGQLVKILSEIKSC